MFGQASLYYKIQFINIPSLNIRYYAYKGLVCVGDTDSLVKT